MTKVPFNLLKKYVFNRIGIVDPDVLIGPSLGEDASIVKLDGKILVAHADPIVGAVENIGWFAVHVACNDIAVRGVKPRWIIPVILLRAFPKANLIMRSLHFLGRCNRISKKIVDLRRGKGYQTTFGRCRVPLAPNWYLKPVSGRI